MLYFFCHFAFRGSGIVERAVPSQLCPVECTVGSERTARFAPGAGPVATGRSDPARDEDDAGDSLPLSPDFARPKRAGMHEGGNPVFTR